MDSERNLIFETIGAATDPLFQGVPPWRSHGSPYLKCCGMKRCGARPRPHGGVLRAFALCHAGHVKALRLGSPAAAALALT